MTRSVWLLALILASVARGYAFSEPNCHDGRQVIVHLFNWKHEDVAAECERWLGPKGFCGVQVSPPNEHAVISDWDAAKNRPWYERYQPVSFHLESRSGSRSQFVDMVNRCEAVRVRIYVDMVINHMSAHTGTGSGGSYYNSETLQYDGVPFSSNDFNCCAGGPGGGNCDSGANCYTSDCGISNYGDANEVRNCRLVGLRDLALHLDYVKGKLVGFFQDLMGIGVAGFRIDACKHMWPSHMQDIFSQLYLPDGSQPYMFNEVIDLGNGEAITGSEYYHLGRVTNFKYGIHLGQAFKRYFPIANLENFGEAWGDGMYPTGNSLVFIENHDNQRGHGAGGADILTFYEAYFYKLAVIFGMSWPYGHVRILSSYSWPGGRFSNDAYGPPTNNGDDIKSVVINSDDSCNDGSDHSWVCEHRWRQIANMALWRNVAGGEKWNIHNWWSNGNQQIAFGRNNQAFLAINNEESAEMAVTLDTGLPAGTYCDIISGNYENGGCTGKEVTVDSSGRAYIYIPSSSDPAVAFHTEWML